MLNLMNPPYANHNPLAFQAFFHKIQKEGLRIHPNEEAMVLRPDHRCQCFPSSRSESEKPRFAIHFVLQ